MTVESLKKEARRHEQREDWIKALDLYRQAIDAQVGEDEPDIALHNRIGDLQVRLGDLEGAIASYDQAITLYLAADLPNNAIAVCRKIVRHDPERPSSFLRMGQIRAKQGFIVDARQNFLTYAEIMQASGETEEAFRALEEFAGLAPADVETRIFLADQLVAQDRSRDAIYYLSEAYRVLSQQDETDRASEVLERIHAIDPDHAVPAMSEADIEVESDPDLLVPGLEDTDDLEITSFEGEDDDTLVTGGVTFGSGWQPDDDDDPVPSDTMVEPTAEVEEDEPTEDTVEVEASWDVEGLEASRFGQFDEPEGGATVGEGVIEGLEATGLADEEEKTASLDEGEAVEAGLTDLEEGLADVEPVGLEDDAEDEEEIDDLPLIRYDLEESIDLEEDEELEEDYAPVSLTDEEEPEDLDSVSVLIAHLEQEPDDSDGWRLLGEEFFAQGRDDEAWGAMERAYLTYADSGDPEKAMRVVRELLLREPQRIDLRQRVVEYAHQTNERTLLVQAFLELADGLRAEGEPMKANSVLEQVLEIDPSNLRANEALQAVPSESEPAPTGVASAIPGEGDGEHADTDGDYIDLGAMVIDEREETTRWKIQEEEPTGDEEADFARMLSQFKEKVAENLSGEDARAHYDLGAAYKDMGLLTEAIGEFQRALRAEPENLAAFEMLGQCFLEQGEAEVAIRTLERGLELAAQVEDELLGVYYWLGQAHETVGNADAAREFYEKIFSLDINFMDVTERLKDLR